MAGVLQALEGPNDVSTKPVEVGLQRLRVQGPIARRQGRKPRRTGALMPRNVTRRRVDQPANVLLEVLVDQRVTKLLHEDWSETDRRLERDSLIAQVPQSPKER